MSQFVDRRLNGKNKSAVNRSRFMRRFKNQIREAVSKAVGDRSIKSMEKGEKITIPAKDINEPQFVYGQGGRREVIHAGNKEFSAGDKFKRPPSGGGEGQGSEASNEGEGSDDFGFEISREEFLDLFFEDLELPNLVKVQIAREPAYKMVRAGYSTQGVPTNISIVRSMRHAAGRRLALTSPFRKQIKELERELELLEKSEPPDLIKINEVKEKISALKNNVGKIPFIDPFDLRYNNRVKRPQPTTQAVMFCLMDVSGSMDEAKKDIAKRFFILLYMFLSRSYENVDVVFIRHHTSAKEVDEEEFFYSRETGGTVVSSALDMMVSIMKQRYPTSDWNIYAAQASDGDNWNNDSPRCKEIIAADIINYVQYFAYVEIMPRHHQSLWEAYQQILETHPNFAMQNIETAKDIYPVFRELFKREQQVK